MLLNSRAESPVGRTLALPTDVSWRLCERFVVLGHYLLVRILGSRVAQDHALERVGHDLMEG